MTDDMTGAFLAADGIARTRAAPAAGELHPIVGPHDEALVPRGSVKTDREVESGGQWDKGGNCETLNPLGPFLVPADEVDDPQAPGLRLWVNGVPRQDSSTKNVIFGVAGVVRYLSWFLVLRPGDVVNTRTPAGVALGPPEPKPYPRAGDVVESEIDGLGRRRQTLGPGVTARRATARDVTAGRA